MLLQERAAAPEVIDACLRAAGFRMGPCELMDLIGHDTNLAVTRSVFEANFGDARYRPSLLQAEMVAGGLLGRKSGRGFYAYPAGAAALPAPDTTPPDDDAPAVLHGRGPLVDALARALETAGRPLPRETDSPWCGLSVVDARLVLTDGPTAATLAARVAVADLAVFDRFDPALGPAPGQSLPLAWAAAPRCSGRWLQQAPRWLALLGFAPQRVADTPGLVVARTLAMLVNEASDAVAQGVCSRDGADAAMKLGVNWPRGPFEWLAAWDADEAAAAAGVVALLRALDDTHRGERYRVNAELRRLAGG
jgi:3-hydroxybutyryl-CoA dehydrogenase